MEALRRPNSQLQARAKVGPWGPTLSPALLPSGKSPHSLTFILYKAFSPDGSCWEVRAPSKVVSSSSSNPLYQREET